MRVVVADIGLNDKGAINWQAQIVKAWDVKRLPWYVVVDPSGKPTTDADVAAGMVEGWLK